LSRWVKEKEVRNMPICGTCGSEYGEEDRFCRRCGFQPNPGENPREGAVGTEGHRGTVLTDKLTIHILLLFVVLGGFLIYNGNQKYQEQKIHYELEKELVLHQAQAEHSLQMLNAIVRNYPGASSGKVYTQYVKDYAASAEICTGYFAAYWDFLDRNELHLQMMGIDTFQMKGLINRTLSEIEKNSRKPEGKLHSIEEIAALREQVDHRHL
jgi:hypothetical protein